VIGEVSIGELRSYGAGDGMGTDQAAAPDLIHNPVSGETIVIRRTGAQTAPNATGPIGPGLAMAKLRIDLARHVRLEATSGVRGST
jgi:hypothetical protein